MSVCLQTTNAIRFGDLDISAPSIVGSLIDVGNELVSCGRAEEAIQVFNTAHMVVRCPASEAYQLAMKNVELLNLMLLTSAASQRQQTQEQQHAGRLQHCRSSQPTAPDLHQEESGCDAGPRILTSTVSPNMVHAHSASLLSATILFNKALVYHQKGETQEARHLYHSVACMVHELNSQGWSLVPSTTMIEIGMRVQNNMSQINYQDGREVAAITNLEASLLFAKTLCEISIEDYGLEYADVLSNWCRLNRMSGDISDNVYIGLDDVLRIRTCLLPANHPDIAAAHYNIGVAEYARGENTRATTHIKEYLRMCKQEDTGLDYLVGLIYLLLIKNEESDDNLSQELVRGLRTLQDKRQDHDQNTCEVASVMNFIGTLLFHKEDFANALVFFQEELKLEDCFVENSDDISISVTCNNIGRILQELGRHGEAIQFYQRALRAQYGDVSELSGDKAQQQRLCCSHSANTSQNTCHLSPSAANLYSTVWYNLGLIHDKQGAFDRAIFAFEMSLFLRREMLGPDHPDIACLLYNIGVLQMEQQRLNEASVKFREALRIRRVGARGGQLNDRHVIKTLEKLATMHQAKGNISDALDSLTEVLALQRVTAEYDELARWKETGFTLRTIAELHHAVGNLTASIEVAQQSVAQLRGALDCHCRIHATFAASNEDRPELVEHFMSSLLLLGSLYHETCEPLQGTALLLEAACCLQVELQTCPRVASLAALEEVTNMLATSSCAAEA